jgi:predicted HNH restriction endonuclease
VAELGDESSASYSHDIVWIVPSDEVAIAANLDLVSDTEGAITLREHRARERSRELRAAKIEAFKAQHGEVYCEVCGFDFERFYGALGSGLIEVHHTKAIADYREGDATEITDLILVCSNCHYVIHRDCNYERNYRQLREVLALRKTMQAPDRKKKRGVQPVQTAAIMRSPSAMPPLL